MQLNSENRQKTWQIVVIHQIFQSLFIAKFFTVQYNILKEIVTLIGTTPLNNPVAIVTFTAVI